eukprot:scaffold164769_cov30-Tisochrysis_lutea.AAC.2
MGHRRIAIFVLDLTQTSAVLGLSTVAYSRPLERPPVRKFSCSHVTSAIALTGSRRLNHHTEHGPKPSHRSETVPPPPHGEPRIHCQTAELHLNPEPKAICHTRSPRLSLRTLSGRRHVAIAVEREARRLEVVGRQCKVLLHSVNDGAATRVHAYPLESFGEVGHVGRQCPHEGVIELGRLRRRYTASVLGGRGDRLVRRVGAVANQRADDGKPHSSPHNGLHRTPRLAACRAACRHVEEELDLLADGQHKRAEVGDVALEGVPRDLHNLLREADAADAVGVFLLVDRLIARVVLSHVSAHRMAQLEARTRRVAASVREQHCRRAAAEEAVGKEHRAVVAAVPILGDVLSGDDESERVALLVRAEQPARQVD